MKARDELEVWRAKDGWRWRVIVPGNGRLIAESGEAYTRKGDAKRAFYRFLAGWIG